MYLLNKQTEQCKWGQTRKNISEHKTTETLLIFLGSAETYVILRDQGTPDWRALDALSSTELLTNVRLLQAWWEKEKILDLGEQSPHRQTLVRPSRHGLETDFRLLFSWCQGLNLRPHAG